MFSPKFHPTSLLLLLAGCPAPSSTTPASAPRPEAAEDVPPEPNDTPEEVVVLSTKRARELLLTLETRKRRWLLGEHIVVHYVVKNVGKDPTSVSFGGDYRGGPRATRIKVLATDASGTLLADPHPKFMIFGGLGGDSELGPGEEFAFTISLGRYRRFERAGVHRISVAHDLGWTPQEEAIGAADERWLQGELEIAVPSAADAKTVLAEMQALPSDANKRVGERARPFADFTALGYPVYLPLLASVVDTESRAMAAISSIGTVEATNVLLKLAEHTDPKVSGPALDAVERRLPWTAATPRFDEAEHAQWVARTWDERELGAAVRTLAESLLGSKDPEAVMRGARLLGAVAKSEDADRILLALDHTLDATRTEPIPYPEPRTAVSELLVTAEVLLGQGVAAKRAPVTPGEIALSILSHGPKPKRPPEYGALAATWLRHDIPQLGVLVLQKTATPLESELRDELPGLVGDPHLGLANAACMALGQIGSSTDAHEPVLSAMKTATDRWLVHCLHSTAVAVGISRDTIAKTWAARLDESEHTLLMLEQLLFVFETSGHGSSGVPDAAEGARLKRAWTVWLREHAEDVQAGVRVILGDPLFPSQLFPEGFTLTNRAGVRWPEP